MATIYSNSFPGDVYIWGRGPFFPISLVDFSRAVDSDARVLLAGSEAVNAKMRYHPHPKSLRLKGVRVEPFPIHERFIGMMKISVYTPSKCIYPQLVSYMGRWWLHYPPYDRQHYTGHFESRDAAVEWFVKGGR